MYLFFHVFYYVSLYSYVPPRALHSFPTRRLPISACGSIGLQPIASDTAFPPREKNAPPALPPKRLPVAIGPYERSEEHTSELQSLRHLVCRLLLEKKKK